MEPTMYRKMYNQLFSAICDALERMETAHYIEAEAILKKAQLEAEQIYLSWEEQDGEL